MPSPEHRQESGERPVEALPTLAKTGSDYEFFQKIPWCKDILHDPRYVTRAYLREPKGNTEDTLFHQTLNTEDTIKAWLSMYRKPAQDASRVDEVRSILHLVSSLCGHPRVCHGGVVATIMDEIMGVLLAVNKNLENAQVQGVTVTAYLNTRYLKPVMTPQVVLITAKIAKFEGRKLFL